MSSNKLKNVSKCVVKGCKSEDVICHRFPNPKKDMQRLNDWMNIVGLKEMDPISVYNKKFICARHFTSNCSSPGTKRLNANAYPSINLTNLNIEQPNISNTNTIDNDIASGSQVLDSTSKPDEKLNDSVISGINYLETSFININSEDASDVVIHSVHAAKTNSKTTKKNKGLLASIGVRNCKQLTPKCKTFYAITNKLLRQQRLLSSKKQLFKNRLQAAETFNAFYMKEKMFGKVNPAASLFTCMQLREKEKKNKGHRFTLDEKLLSLSIYKKSPKCYRLLSILFTLPSKRTLNNILGSVQISPGVSSVVMHVLKENIQKLKPLERYCSLIFDEISLSSGLQYNAFADQIDGFVNSGYYKSQELADHALVFMVRGIKKKFKQPVAFSFCQGSTKQFELVRQLKEVIQKVHQTGLRIVATICDQGKSNEGAITLLKTETRAYYIQKNTEKEYRDEFYEVELENKDRIKIVHLFDVPHLLKCTRNNLITKNLIFEMDGSKRIAKWDHLQQLYTTNSCIPDTKMLPRLTDNHVIPQKIYKMKVRYASQVFSQRVSAIMHFLASKTLIEPSAVDTAAIFLFFDKLFDSMNGSFSNVVDGKIYRTAITKNSVHHELWNDSLKILGSMRFVEPNGKHVNVPTIRNWITTVKGFQALTKLFGEKGFKSLLPRHLNQDSIENFFGAVRSLGCKNPTCSSFISAYKTLLLNNLISSQSPGTNCEDFFENSLTSYQHFFLNKQEPSIPVKLAVDLPIQIQRKLNPSTNDLMLMTHTYIAGFIAKKLNQEIFKNCKLCLNKICSSQVTQEHAFIGAREYQNNTAMSLKYPGTEFRILIHNIIVYINDYLPSKCHSPGIGEILIKYIITNYDLSILHCLNHNLFKIKIAKSIVKLIINHWCTDVNRLLHGKHSLIEGNSDPIKKQAHVWYNKHKKKKIICGKYNRT